MPSSRLLPISSRIAFVVLLGAGALGIRAAAQSQSPLQGIKDAWKNAKAQTKQGQTKSTQPTQQQSTQAAAAVAGSPGSTAAASSGAAEGDCCSVAAMKKIAAGASGLDIVGIKLGMTPQEAFAAVQAFNPKLQIEMNKVTHIEMPPDYPNRDLIVPWFAIAHTVGAAWPGSPPSFTLKDGSSDQIILEFSTPPTPPMVVRVIRYVSFPTGQPLVSSTLVASLTKKYGAMSSHGPDLSWAYDLNGKLLNGPFDSHQNFCMHVGVMGWGLPGIQIPSSAGDLTHRWLAPSADPGIDSNGPGYSAMAPACRNMNVVVATPGDDMGPNMKVVHMTVYLESPGLIYASYKNAHDWVKAKFDAYQKKVDDAAKQRSGPTL